MAEATAAAPEADDEDEEEDEEACEATDSAMAPLRSCDIISSHRAKLVYRMLIMLLESGEAMKRFHSSNRGVAMYR